MEYLPCFKMCFGKFSKLCHWGPITALGIIKVVTTVTIYCTNMWWPRNTFGGKVNSLIFISLSGLTIYNFLSSVYHGPGYVPFSWQPVNTEECVFLQYCGVCKGYKAPRSHHCRKCGRCVLKMDHHCPWINRCVGWGNHAHFIFFLFFAIVGCAHASVILSCSLYRAIHRNYYLRFGLGKEPIVSLGVHGMVFCVLSLGLSIGVVAAVGMLFYCQVKAVIKNRTGIEDWIIEKAIFRRRFTNEQFVFPYDLGLKNNVLQVINFSCQPVGDGIYWPLAKGCNQYDLTIEQLAQKNEKQHKKRLYTIIKPASGRWFPITHGIRVCVSFPCTDEPRISLNIGDKVVVSRWRKHWLFGEKLQLNLTISEESQFRIRGWFPRKCAVATVESNEEDCLSFPNESTTPKKYN